MRQGSKYEEPLSRVKPRRVNGAQNFAVSDATM
jgi:hypothetical protein